MGFGLLLPLLGVLMTALTTFGLLEVGNTILRLTSSPASTRCSSARPRPPTPRSCKDLLQTSGSVKLADVNDSTVRRLVAPREGAKQPSPTSGVPSPTHSAGMIIVSAPASSPNRQKSKPRPASRADGQKKEHLGRQVGSGLSPTEHLGNARCPRGDLIRGHATWPSTVARPMPVRAAQSTNGACEVAPLESGVASEAQHDRCEA